jgi:hypothetical protein
LSLSSIRSTYSSTSYPFPRRNQKPIKMLQTSLLSRDKLFTVNGRSSSSESISSRSCKDMCFV